MLKLTLSLLAAAYILAACNEQVELQVASTPVSNNLPENVSVKVAAEQVCQDTTFTDAEGVERKGLRDCKNPNRPCEKMGDTFCMMQDVKLYGVLDDNLTEENVKQGVRFHGKVGKLVADLDNCSSDGQSGCVVPGEAMALSAATIAAHVVKEQVLAGVEGTHNPGFPERSMVLASDTVNGHPGLIPTCNADGQTSCNADGSYRAVALTELKPERIRKTVTLGGVSGSYRGAYGNCSADGEDHCITTTDFTSLDKTSLNAAKIRQNVRLAGVRGSLIERPGDCSADGAEGCVTTSSFPAANFSVLTAGNIKNGTTIAGVGGQYPSANFRLVDATGQPDLSSSNFNQRMISAKSFEYWDAAGRRYVGTGDADLTSANILTGTKIFGIFGFLAGMPAPCSDSLSLACVTTANHVAYDASKLTSGNIKNGTILGAVTGGYPSAAHPMVNASAIADLKGATFAAQMKSSQSFQYWTATGEKVVSAGSDELNKAVVVKDKTIFGIVGELTTRPANCADGLLQGCVTSSSFPAYDPALINEGVIKSGVIIGKVTGKYPSISYPLADATTTTDLTQGNFATRMPSALPFEYWDSAGNRYAGQGDALLAGSHLKKDLDIFGVTGTIEQSAADCSAGNATGCVATSSFPAYNKAQLVPAVIKTGAKVMGVTGIYPSVAAPLAGSDTEVADLGNQADLHTKLAKTDSFEFFDSEGKRYSQSGSISLNPANIITGKTIFTVSGGMTEQPENCVAEGDTGCLATASYPAFDAGKLTAGVIKKGVSLGGVTGRYPSASFPLPGASVQDDLSGSLFNSQVSSAGSYEYWDSTGVRHSKTVATAISSPQILSGVTLFGVNGSAQPTPVDCSVSKSTSCKTSADFPSHIPSDFSEGIIKNGVKVAGTTGKYPSANYKLPGATNTPDLTTGNHGSRIKNSAAFEYWDASGTRYSGVGSEAILTDNLKKNVTVFGVTGNLIEVSGSVPSADKIRYGVKIGTTTGTLRLNCQEGSTDPAHDCSNTFVDITSGGCRNGVTCILRDNITKMQWREITSSSPHTWGSAQGSCTSPWRLPTMKEFITAASHGFVNGANKLGSLKSKFIGSAGLWTATRWSKEHNKVWVFNPTNFASSTPGFNYQYKNLCVR